MATSTQVQQLIASYLPEWFTGAAADGFNVPIDPANIKGYLTSPNVSSESPNWCILGCVSTRAQTAVLDEWEHPVALHVLLFSRIEKDPAQAEASREAAEYWINDAEELMVRRISALGRVDNYWTEVVVSTPVRDQARAYWGTWRVSRVPFTVEKI